MRCLPPARSEAIELAACGPADRHRFVAARFGELAESTPDWDAPTPVTGWVARDAVAHLVEWFRGFLATGGIELAARANVDTDPVHAWRAYTSAVQALLDAPTTANPEFTHPLAGTQRLQDAIDTFYTADVFMHTWDLSRAIGEDGRPDPDYSAHLLSGMEPIEEALRTSCHYGPAVSVPADAEATTRLIGFIGRDPNWQPPRRAATG